MNQDDQKKKKKKRCWNLFEMKVVEDGHNWVRQKGAWIEVVGHDWVKVGEIESELVRKE